MTLNETELIRVLSSADLRKEMRDNTVSLRWATVTGLNPLTVRRDGESESFEVTGSVVDTSLLEVTDRVRVSDFGSKAFIESSQNALTRLETALNADSTRWGSLIPAGANLNDYTTPGQWYNPSNAEVAGFTSGPPSNLAGALIVVAASGVIQYWHDFDTGADANVWRRRWYSNSWSPWTLHAGPALFESGSNANGQWFRFPKSGLQVCQHYFTTSSVAINNAYGNLYISLPLTWTYPRAFTSTPSVTCGSFQWGTGASWGAIISTYGEYVSYRGLDAVSRATGTEVRISLTAIGLASS